MKRCARCEEDKTEEEFGLWGRAGSGLRSICRICAAADQRYRYHLKGGRKRKRPYTNERIPVGVLAPLILKWAKENNVESLNKNSWDTKGAGWINHLAALSGVGVRTIWRIRNGGSFDARQDKVYDHVSFDTADKLTSAMECNEEWTSGSLAPYYGPLTVKPYERHFEQPLYEVAA